MYAPANGLGAAGFVDHALRYNSPSWGGFSMALLASPGNATQTDPTLAGAGGGGGNIGGKGGRVNYQAGLKFKIGTGEIFGGYSHDAANDAQKLALTNGVNGDSEKVWRLGTAWNFGDFRLAAQYDKIKNALAGNGGTTCSGGAQAGGATTDAAITTTQCNSSLNANGDGDIWFLSGQYKIGKTTLVLQGGETKADSVSNAAGVLTASERKAKNLTAGAIYSLSKRTRVFGGYQRVTIDGARSVDNATATGVVNPAFVQPDRSTWTVGMRHDF
jgi:GBP family porin